CLVECEAAQGRSAARKKSLWERNDRRSRARRRSAWDALPGRGWREGQRNRVAVRYQEAQSRGTRKTESPCDWVVRGVMKKESQEAGTRTNLGIRVAEVGAVETPLRRLGGAVARLAEPRHST